MDLTWLGDFEALAETGNFSRAAEARNVTQPAFSRRIRALEDWAGTKLFERGTQPIALTEAGRQIRPLLADVARRLDQAREEAGVHATGSLRFAATHALSFNFFPSWLRGLGLPPVAIHLMSDGLEACERLMLGGRADFLLCHHHPAAPGALDAARFLSRQVGEDRLRLVSAPGDGGALHAADNPEAPMLGYGRGSGLGRIVEALAVMRQPAVFTSHLAATLRNMALSGSGLAWLPESLIAEDLADRRLVSAGGPSEHIAVSIRMFRPAAELGRAGRTLWAQLPE